MRIIVFAMGMCEGIGRAGELFGRDVNVPEILDKEKSGIGKFVKETLMVKKRKTRVVRRPRMFVVEWNLGINCLE